jgi:hypothetical protein
MDLRASYFTISLVVEAGATLADAMCGVLDKSFKADISSNQQEAKRVLFKRVFHPVKNTARDKQPPTGDTNLPIHCSIQMTLHFFFP